MIKQLNIQNFQSHKETSLDFVPGLNVITGKSDSGKTAIIRALRWLIWNRPGGEAFRSHWGGDTDVSIILDKTAIIRTKGNENSYSLGSVTTTECNIFKAFGQNVPEEIIQTLNLEEVNLQMQFDRPFLIMESPGAVAVHFNKVAHLEKIDISVKNLRSEIRQINTHISSNETQLEQLTEDIKEYDDLDKFEAELEVLEEMENKRDIILKQWSKLSEMRSEASQTIIEIAALSESLKMEKDVDHLLKLYNDQKTILSEHNELSDIINNIYDLETETANIALQISVEPKIDFLLETINKKNELVKEFQELRRMRMDLVDLNVYATKNNMKLNELETTFHEEMPDECPLCGQKIKK